MGRVGMDAGTRLQKKKGTKEQEKAAHTRAALASVDCRS
jgi:hypothetical protein